MRRNLAALRRPKSLQGVLGVLCVVAAVGLLAGYPWALLTLGVFLLVAALFDSIDRAVHGDDDDDGPEGY